MRTLILGAGKYQRQDKAFHVDILPFKGIDLVHDLNQTPWPIVSDSFDAAMAIHVVEHLQSLINFMNECHRIIAKGGELYIETPLAGANPDLEFCDPTHIRCYRKHTFINYFTKSGIEKFGYTDKAWAVLHVGTKTLEVPDDTLVFHGTPIK